MLLLSTRAVENFSLVRFHGMAKTLVFSYFLYILFCAISITWSVSPSSTLMHSILLLGVLFFSVSSVRYDTEKTIDALQKIILACIILSWLALPINPEYALQQKGIWRLRGIFFHEFELGFVCAMLIIVLCIRWCKASVIQHYGTYARFYFIFLITFGTLLATQTRTLLAYTFVVCLICMIFFAKGKKRLMTLGIFLVGILAGIILQDSFVSAFSRGESDMTLSGRTIIWERAIAIAERSPTLGYGFGSFTNHRFDADFSGFYGTYRPPHAHNSWIMAFFETGIIGVTLISLFLVLQLIYGIRLAKKDTEPPYGLFFALLATVSGCTSLIYAGNVAALAFLPLVLLLQRSREIYLDVEIKER